MPEIRRARNVLTIFLGSPGDLDDERRITRKIIDRFNRNFCNETNWSIDLLGWEDTLPSYKRPQEQINRDLNRCDLFIGLLYKRWGTPSGTFSSGFEEEFELTQARRSITDNHPEIWLFFKDVPPEYLKDPGEQLKKVLEFRRKIENERRLLYQTFPSSERWEELLGNAILKFVLQKNQNELNSKVTGRSNKPWKRSRSKRKAAKTKENNPKGTQEIAGMLSNFQNQVKGKSAADQSIQKIARLYFFSQIQYSRYYPTETLNHHVVNSLYAIRKKVNFTSEELFILIRAIIKDENDFVPGWYWFGLAPSKNIFNLILSEGKVSSVEEIRKSNWDFLTRNNILPPKDSTIGHEDLKHISEEKSPNVKESAKKYLNWATKQDPSLIDTVEQERFPDLFEKNALELERKKIVNFLRHIQEGKTISYSTHPFFYNFVSDISTEDLIRAIDIGSREVKLFAARELEKRNLIDLKTGNKLLEDSDASLVGVGLRAMIRAGLALLPSTIRKLLDAANAENESDNFYGLLRGNESEEIVALLFNSYSFEQLQEHLDWFSEDSPIAYKVIAEKYFELFKNRLRADLGNEFSSFRAAEIKKIRDEVGAEADKFIEKLVKPDVDSFILQRHLAAALNALVKNGQSSDIVYARKYSTSMTYNTRDVIFALFEKYSGPEDQGFLKEQLKSSNDSEKMMAAKLLLNMSKTFNDWPKLLLESGDIKLFKLAIKYCLDNNLRADMKYLKSFLYNEGDDFRELALSYLVLKQSYLQLEKILSDYCKNEKYYYNVVVWIDRILYSPLNFRNSYKTKLTANIAI